MKEETEGLLREKLERTKETEKLLRIQCTYHTEPLLSAYFLSFQPPDHSIALGTDED